MRTLQTELVAKGLNPKKKQPNESSEKQKKEKFSKRELEELMGMRMPKYKRNKGALRQR